MKIIFLKSVITIAVIVAMTGCEKNSNESDLQKQAATENAAPQLQKISGVDKQNFDQNIHPQDDFYQYINGAWINKTTIPSDESSWGAANEISELTTNQLHDIVNQLLTQKSAEGSTAQKISDLYKSFMDEKGIEALGVKPLKGELSQLDSLKNNQDLALSFAHLSQIGVATPIDLDVGQDMKNSKELLVSLSQGGLGLPDLDNYLKHDAKNTKIRKLYVAHIKKTFNLADEKQAAEKANDILKLETQLAKIQWTNIQNQDLEKAYNIYKLEDLSQVAKAFDWNAYLKASGLTGKVQTIQLNQLSYFKGLDSVIGQTPLETWKVYLKWQLISGYSSVLSKAFVDAEQDFENKKSIEPIAQLPRWKRGMDIVDTVLGEGLGQIYVQKHFPSEKKQHIEALVKNILQVYDQNLAELDWMSQETKTEARKKLSNMAVKVGYPKTWRDYSTLVIKDNDIVGNLMRANQFGAQYQINKLGKPVDRDEWMMTPQTMNAYYNPALNEIVFPAAILQSPFFDTQRDDAINYGAIGSIIGHEISHAFDDQGSKFDESGNMKNWWTAEDSKHYQDKSKLLVEQYGRYEVLPKHYVDGELTLGENIADNLGVSMAYKAYQKSLAGKDAPVLDGFTGPQRFYIGLAQIWRSKHREDEVLDLLMNDTHAPDKVRVNGTLVNQPSFYEAFGLKEGHKMYLAPNKRISIW